MLHMYKRLDRLTVLTTYMPSPLSVGLFMLFRAFSLFAEYFNHPPSPQAEVAGEPLSFLILLYTHGFQWLSRCVMLQLDILYIVAIGYYQ